MLQLPELGKIRKALADTDLKILAIDEDNTAGTADQLLQRRGYDWDNFHYTRAIVKALQASGIPLTVLADANGKIVYYHSGADDPDGLRAAIAKLGPAYHAVNEIR